MNAMKRTAVLGAVAAGPLLGLANAQVQNDYYSRDKYEAVMDRQQPEFDPDPLRVGTLIVRPVAEASLVQDSNIFAQADNEVSDTVARFGASVDAVTDWSNHEVGASVAAFSNTYLDNDDNTNEEISGELRGRLDATQSFSFGGRVFAAQRSEQATAFTNSVGLQRPVENSVTGAEIEANYRNDRIRWENLAGIRETDFEDGEIAGTNAVFDQDFRDETTTYGRSRLSYAVSPNVAVFTQATAQQREFDQDQLIDGDIVSRDSDGYTLSAGVDFELQALIRGDIAVGHLNENRKDSAFEDVSGLFVDGRLQWFPSPLTTVTATAGRRVLDLGLLESPTATQTRFGGRVDHELRRNVILSGFASISNEDYDDIDRTDDVTQYGVAATYKVNKNVHAEAFAQRVERDASGTSVFGNPDFSTNLIGIGIRIFP